MVDNTYHAGTVRDVAAMNAASSTGYTMTNAATNTSADSQLTVHDFLSGLAQLRDVLDNTNDNNIGFAPDTVCCSFVLDHNLAGLHASLVAYMSSNMHYVACYSCIRVIKHGLCHVLQNCQYIIPAA